MEKEKIKKAVKITGPQIQEASLTVPDGSIEDLMSQARDAEEELTGLRVKGIQAADCDFSKIRLRSIVFENCRFFGCRFTGSSLVDLQIRACDFSNCDFSGAYFSRCRMESVKGVGVTMPDSHLSDQIWRDCSFRYGNFHGCRIEIGLPQSHWL